MRTYRAGIVGLGQIGFLFDRDERTRRRYLQPTHASAYTAHPRTELVAACDRKAERLQEFQDRYGIGSVYTDVDAMLEKEALDALSVCVPPEAQADVVRAGLRHRVPLVFCEKPFTMSAASAEALLAEARRSGTRVLVNYWRRFDRSHGEVGRCIHDGRLGSLRQIRVLYGNGLLNTASHGVDLALWYAGPAQWVMAAENPTGRAGGELDFVVGFARGARAVFTHCDFTDYRVFEIDVLGSGGRITISNEGLLIGQYSIRDNEDVSGARQLAPQATEIPSTVGAAMPQAIDHVVAALDAEEPVFADHAVRTHAVLEAARAAATRRETVFL